MFSHESVERVVAASLRNRTVIGRGARAVNEDPRGTAAARTPVKGDWNSNLTVEPLSAHDAPGGFFFDRNEWSGWINLGGDLASVPAVTSGGPHDLDVFVRGENDELVHRFFDRNEWSGWINLGGQLAAGPAVTSRGPHDLDVFVDQPGWRPRVT